MVARTVIVRGPIWEHLFLPLYEQRWADIPREQSFEGPAGTGKSVGIGFFLDTVARQFPKARILVIRKTRVSLSQSWMVTFEEKVLRENDPIRMGATRAHRTSYLYPNGTELVMGGMDNETRTFSTEYDIIYCNEATEFTEEEVESLHRALRNGKLPFQCMILDCNPDSEFHWLNQRCDQGPTVRRVTRLWHNPAYYLPDGWSEDGASYRSGLMSGLSGVRYKRLVEGIWSTAEGTIIPIDRATHVLEGTVAFPQYKRPRLEVKGWEKPIEVRFFYGAYDHGFRNPGTFQVWAVDDQKRAYLVHEVYAQRKDEDWWAEQIVQADEKYMLHRVICDSASPEKIQKFNRVIREARDRLGRENAAVARPAGKSQKGGKTWLEIQAMLMRRRFELDSSGASRAYVFANALVADDDPDLRNKPKGLIQEAAGWTYEKYDSAKHRGQPKEVGDPDKPNHSIDAASYGFEWLETHDLPDGAEDRWGNQPPPPGSWAEADLYWKKPPQKWL